MIENEVYTKIKIQKYMKLRTDWKIQGFKPVSLFSDNYTKNIQKNLQWNFTQISTLNIINKFNNKML